MTSQKTTCNHSDGDWPFSRNRVRRALTRLALVVALGTSWSLAPAEPVAAVSYYSGSCTGQWSCFQTLAWNGGGYTSGPGIYGINFTASETNLNVNTGQLLYPNGTSLEDDTDSARNRNGGTSRSVYAYALYSLSGTCRERPYDSVMWRVIPWSVDGVRSTTVAPLNARACTNF